MVLWLGMATTVAAAWHDDFDATTLDPAWRFLAPVDGPTASLTEQPGRFRVRLPQRNEGYDLWVGRDAAPRLLREAPAGDWDLEASLELVELPPASNVHFGLSIFPSEKFGFTWGIFQGHDIWNMSRPEVWLEYPSRGRVLTAPLEGNRAVLGLRKRGEVYTCLTQVDGRWVEAGQATLPFAPRYVGILFKTYGNGPGVVLDVDRVALAAVEPAVEAMPEARVTVHADRPAWPIHPYIYGQFIEHMHRCIYHNGLWAERLSNRKFTGRADGHGVVEGWKAVGAGEGVAFAPDTRVWLAPAQSQRVSVAAPGRERGVAQGGLVLERGRRYSVRTVLRGENLTGPVTVSLRAGERVLVANDVGVGADWTTSTCELACPEDVGDGSFAITTTGAGTLWLGAVSLMPADHIEGFRRDVIEAIRELRVPLLRWPGGNFVSGYHWQDGLGDRDRRPVRWDRAWGGWEPNDVGTDEFLALCRLIGAEPYICANAGEATPAEAAAWVEYCNGPVDSHYGALRAANGHDEPYGVRIWGLGNEMYGNWQLGALDPEKYALKAVEMATLMRAASPVPLQLVAVGVDGDHWDHWTTRVARLLGWQSQWQSAHYYLGVDTADAPETQYLVVAQSPGGIEQMLAETARLVDEAKAADHPVPIAFDEWNIWKGTARADTGYENDYALAEGLWACNVFHLLHRLGDRVTMANLAQLVNVLGAIQTDQTTLAKTPLYYAFLLYRHHFGERFVPSEVAAPPLTPSRSLVDVSVADSEDGRRLHLAVVNWHPSRPVKVTWDLGFAPPQRVEEARLAGPSFHAMNRVGALEEVTVTVRERLWAEVAAEPLPPHTATVYTLERR